MTDLKQLLGTNMKIYRNTSGLSQAKLAEKADTTTNYISAIEAGRRFPSVEILDKIAAALEIDTPELFSMKHIQYDNAVHNLEEQVWEDVKQKITSYISKQISGIKKLKTEIR